MPLLTELVPIKGGFSYKHGAPQQPAKGARTRGCKSHPSNWAVHDGTVRCLSRPQGWRGLSSPDIEPTGRNEDEPHRMSLVMLKARRRRASGALREGRCLQEIQSPNPANSVGVSVVSTSGRCASDKRGDP